jgi:hypothetical protein
MIFFTTFKLDIRTIISIQNLIQYYIHLYPRLKMIHTFTKNRKSFLLPFFFLAFLAWGPAAQASHIRGGQIYYKSDTTAARNPLRFFFTLVTYSVAPPYAEDPEATLYFGDCTSQRVDRSSRVLVPNAPLNTYVNTYQFEHTYTGPGEFKVTYVGAATQGGVVNIASSIKETFFLQSMITVDRLLGPNHSPVFQRPLLDIPIRNQVFMHQSGALDAEGDSLSYKVVLPAASNGQTACGNPNGIQTPGISGLENFLGTVSRTVPAGLTLDRKTGLLTWNTPGQQGIFNLAILVEEWRDGRLIGTVTRDMLLYALADPVLTGLPDDWHQLVSTYPTPATSTLNLKLPASIQLRGSYLFTAMGVPMPLPIPSKSQDGWAFHVAGLPGGMYLLHLQTSHGNMVQKVVIHR